MRGDLKKLVKSILMYCPETRDDDYALVYKVWQEENEMMLSFKLGYVLSNFQIFGVSSIESIGRARRKLQADFPELRASEEVQRARQKKELDYLAIARSDGD